MAFDAATRRKLVPMAAVARPVGGGTTSIQLPRTGLLARVYLLIRGSVAGTLTVPNAFGMSSIVRRVRLQANSGVDIFNMSGPGYHHLFRDMQELESDSIPNSNGRSAVTATTFNVDMVLPVAINQRDPIGLVMLQSEQTTLQLIIDWEADATVATGATVTGTVTPYLELFTVPVDQNDWPPLTIIHQVLEDQAAIPAAGEFDYIWPRGNTYLQVIHGAGFAVAGADNWTRAQLRLNQSDYLLDLTPNFRDLEWQYTRLTLPRPGVIPFDLLGSAGLGVYDKTRDVINSALVTDLTTVLQASAAGTLYTVRRQFVTLG